MDQAHLHLLTNHVSLFALAFGALILVLGFIRKSEELKYGSAILFIIGAIMFFPAKQTGGGAAGIVKKIPTVDKAAIKEHAEASKWVMPFSTALGVISLLGLIMSRKKKAMPKWASILMLILSLFTFSILARTAYLGGFIRHTEIHKGGAATGVPTDSSGHDADSDGDGDDH